MTRPGHLHEADRSAGFEMVAAPERFSRMNDMFTRAVWDARVRLADADAVYASYRMEAAPRRGDGVTQTEFALRRAARLIADLVSDRAAEAGVRDGIQGFIRDDTPVAPMRADLGLPEEEAAEIKGVARLFGAVLVGITHRDDRWHYADRPDTRVMEPVANDLPDGLSDVIVMGHTMDAALVAAHPGALAGAATGREYSREAVAVVQLAAYIRTLGHRAVASMNDTALVIPCAIEAGLAEFGRSKMVLTPEFGPRVRFSKIFTDRPLAVDGPRALGLKDQSAEYDRGCPFTAPRRGGLDAMWYKPATGGFGQWGRRVARAVAPRLARPRLRPKEWWAARKRGTREAKVRGPCGQWRFC